MNMPDAPFRCPIYFYAASWPHRGPSPLMLMLMQGDLSTHAPPSAFFRDRNFL